MKVLIVSKDNCSHCEELRVELVSRGVQFKYINIKDCHPEAQRKLRSDARAKGITSMPIVAIDGELTTVEELKEKLRYAGY